MSRAPRASTSVTGRRRRSRRPCRSRRAPLRPHRPPTPQQAGRCPERCRACVETKLLLVRDRPPERALAVGDKAVHRDAHRVDQPRFKLIAPARRTMIAMKFTIELDIGLPFPSACCSATAGDRSRHENSSSWAFQAISAIVSHFMLWARPKSAKESLGSNGHGTLIVGCCDDH